MSPQAGTKRSSKRRGSAEAGRKAVPVQAGGLIQGGDLTISRPELISNGTDEALRDLIHDFLAYARQINACRDAFASIVGVTGMQYEIMMTVHRRGNGTIGIKDIADMVHRSSAFVTIEVNKLVSRGLIQKASHPGDRRCVLLGLSPKAIAKMRKVVPLKQRVNDVLFECLDRSSLRVLGAVFKNLVHSGDRAMVILEYLSGATSSKPRSLSSIVSLTEQLSMSGAEKLVSTREGAAF